MLGLLGLAWTHVHEAGQETKEGNERRNNDSKMNNEVDTVFAPIAHSSCHLPGM